VPNFSSKSFLVAGTKDNPPRGAEAHGLADDKTRSQVAGLFFG
jgi:hypothetical protein